MAAVTTLRAQKKILRKAITTVLKPLPVSAIEEQSQAVAARVLALPSFDKCRSVSCYLSMPTGEIDTTSLVSEILRRDKSFFVPKIETTEGHMQFLKLYGKEDLDTLPSGTWGIKEPGPQWNGSPRVNVLDRDCEELDMILLPGVAFDYSLSRLGHGKGYYDRFIASYVASGRPRPLLATLVALALREQVLEGQGVPIGDTDWKMDFIVTPDAVLSNAESNQ
ncbi:hypothetical protein BDZ94DRAFT_1210358 [Collybia nuda]|uniref:5-formyltetrahydrofolate cyclo-ligase n=1 Tax=Collybia nuda TaxID=64659 RepID=A0A9P6CPQ1_9AGAR|nr:hypothetical protein BDZ94DRAFT_1210358 [Collybia nuda]